MKKLLGFILIQLYVLFGISPALFAQEELTKDQIYKKIQELVNDAGQSLSDSPDCDPYGFQISIKMSKKEDGVASNALDADTIKGFVSDMLRPHKFEKFNLGIELNSYTTSPGYIYISVGLTPVNAKNETFAVNFHSYTLKENIDGQYSFYTIQVGAQFIIETPDNGVIEGNVLDGDGARIPDTAFKSPPSEKKVRYRRLGPGDDAANSGEPDNDDGWKDFQDEPNFKIEDLTPGHYFPSVKLNGCIQKLEDPELNKNEEVMVLTEPFYNTESPTEGQTILRPDGVDATNVDDAKIHTTFSTGNTVEGFLLTEGQTPGPWRDKNYILKEQVQILKTEMKILLEPLGWTSNSPDFPMEQMSKDGTYKFEKIPSGVYWVYFDKQKGSGRVVEVCNCDENKQPTQANLVYQQNMRTEGYEITLDYKFNYQGESFNLKATWGNVVMAFGDENTIPQKYSLYTEPNKDSLDNQLDIEGKVLQPPFVIIDDPYFYANCGDDYRYCSDIFRKGPMPPIDFSYSKSGEFFGQIGADPDFRKDGLYNEFQAVEYKKDVEFEDESRVTKGIYFTWQFAFNNSTDALYPGFSMAASEIYDWIEEQGGDGMPASHVLAGGTVDARVPDDVIEQIKKGEDFEIKKEDKAVTYILKGTMPNKTATATKPLLSNESNLLVSVFPNPTNDFIILNIVETRHALSLSYQLYDVNGKLLESKQIEGKQTNIAMGGLLPANYFLKVTQGNKEIKTFKIIKH